MIENIFLLIELIGIVSFSIAGAIIAIDKETDLFGVVFLAVTTCFGGGIIRDITIGRHPPALFGELLYQLYIVIAVAILVFIFVRVFRSQYVKRKNLILIINNYIDALALGIFSVAGVQTCIGFMGDRAGFVLCVVMGMTTAVGGGMIRDLILRDIPFILRKRIYALAALIGAVVYYLFVRVFFPNSDVAAVIGQIVSVSTVLVIRVLATVFKWNLPKAIDFTEVQELEKEEVLSNIAK